MLGSSNTTHRIIWRHRQRIYSFLRHILSNVNPQTLCFFYGFVSVACPINSHQQLPTSRFNVMDGNDLLWKNYANLYHTYSSTNDLQTPPSHYHLWCLVSIPGEAHLGRCVCLLFADASTHSAVYHPYWLVEVYQQPNMHPTLMFAPYFCLVWVYDYDHSMSPSRVRVVAAVIDPVV